MIRTRVFCVVFLTLLVSALPSARSDPLTLIIERPDFSAFHRLSAEVSLNSRSPGFSDPYTLPAGAGIAYGYHGLFGLPWVIGISVMWNGFSSLLEGFGPSFVLWPAVQAGYEKMFGFPSGFRLLAAAGIGYGHYIRYHLFLEDEYWAYRPFAQAYISGGIITDIRTVFTLGFRYTLVFDVQREHLFGLYIRVGYVFPRK
ncbi:MAG: hypothetical protein ACOCYA_03615 [Spirochaetota bacterium]